ncbi:universal stress protein [Salinibaculum salinum]|uniref:universal stress protein n=1 Tax=Salinibaculum salinum TaxID=3131996 RepID=UPI0030ED7100
MLDILVPVDNSAQAEKAFKFALKEFPEHHLSILHVIDSTEISKVDGVEEGVAYPNSETYDRLVEAANEILDEYIDHAEGEGVEADAVHNFGDPARRIVEYTAENDIDHVVIGSHGRTGFSRVLLGSVAEKVVRRAPVPVTVVRGDVKTGRKNLLVPIDNSEQAKNALDYALERYPDSSITLLNVFSRGPPESYLERRGKDYDNLRARRREWLGRLAAERDQGGEIETEVVIGDPARKINEYVVDQDIEHIVMGSHGRDRFARILLGSVAEMVVRRAPVPVTVVREQRSD